jgi:hypothetical protein
MDAGAGSPARRFELQALGVSRGEVMNKTLYFLVKGMPRHYTVERLVMLTGKDVNSVKSDLRDAGPQVEKDKNGRYRALDLRE